jgi:SAM-dependent methyltransferase
VQFPAAVVGVAPRDVGQLGAGAVLRETARMAQDGDKVAPEARAEFGWEDWTWDDSVFRGTAPYYRKGRYPYAPGLADALARSLDLDGHGRLLDVGCGPGSVTLLFAPLFERAVGIDADAEMVSEARRAAAGGQVANVEWLQLRAEELPSGLGTFRVITFAQSFHWMDRESVAAVARTMLDSGGAVVHVDMWHRQPLDARASDRFPPVPDEEIDALRVQWLGPHRRAGQGLRDTSPSGEDEVFQAAGFAPEEIVVVPDGRVVERSIEEVVAWVLSMSSTAPHLFGDELGSFTADVRKLLVNASPDGRFSARLADNRLRIHRPV